MAGRRDGENSDEKERDEERLESRLLCVISGGGETEARAIFRQPLTHRQWKARNAWQASRHYGEFVRLLETAAHE
jgi:hypothetical protein